ncbi:MAG: hypothetical protein EOM25_13880 [Deltaproteobacteria bacterium]|nr:hypothetical protein [Deltaproteobacteria bacterium]
MSIVRQTAIAPRATLAMGAAGAIVGGAVAAARSIDKVQKGETSREEAVKEVIRESGTTGLATAALCCIKGLRVRGAATEIPQAATAAVVQSIATLFFLSALRSVLTYV